MNIITVLSFFIFGLNCRSISRKKATNENHHFTDDQWSIEHRCLEHVSKRCQKEYGTTKDIEVCKCVRFKSECDIVNLCWDHLLESKPKLFI